MYVRVPGLCGSLNLPCARQPLLDFSPKDCPIIGHTGTGLAAEGVLLSHNTLPHQDLRGPGPASDYVKLGIL